MKGWAENDRGVSYTFGEDVRLARALTTQHMQCPTHSLTDRCPVCVLRCAALLAGRDQIPSEARLRSRRPCPPGRGGRLRVLCRQAISHHIHRP